MSVPHKIITKVPTEITEHRKSRNPNQKLKTEKISYPLGLLLGTKIQITIGIKDLLKNK